MIPLLRRTAALVVALSLGTAGWAECAGWQATSEARIACCSASGPCPMHGAGEPGAPAEGVVTQHQADSCCAASEPDQSIPAPAAFSLTVSAALAIDPLSTLAPITTPAASDAWRTRVPLPPGHVSKHVLLSVFLL